MNQGVCKEDILAGIFDVVAGKTASLLEKIQWRGKSILLLGGMSRFKAYTNSLRSYLPGAEILREVFDSRLASAVGALHSIAKSSLFPLSIDYIQDDYV